MSRTITVAGASLELEERGDGRPLLFLHPGEGLEPVGAAIRGAETVQHTFLSRCKQLSRHQKPEKYR